MKKALLVSLMAFAYTGYADTWNILPDTAQYEVIGAVKTIKQCFLDEKTLKQTEKSDNKGQPCDWQVINHFNTAGNLTQREFISRGYRLDYNYKKDNDLTRIDFYDEKHVPTHVIFPVNTKTNEKGILRTVRYPDDVVHHRYDIVPIEKASLGSLDKRKAVRREYQYDKLGRLVNTLYYSFYYHGLDPIDQRQLRYDDKGRLEFILYRTESTSAPRNLLDYNDKGILITERYVGHSASNDNATVYNNQYTRDSQGNWITLQQSRKGKLVGVTYREIEYYNTTNPRTKEEEKQ
ncbi:MAG: hypothetical protein KGV50_03210 [Gammaproteobacteria bacterium]|nr:hypothetical protein [Gammaproteobacteria bacterium]